MPTKLKSKELVVCHESFAGNDVNIARGTRLREDNPIVERYPQFFIDANTPDDEWPRHDLPPEPPERLTGRFKLRVLPGQGSENRGTGEPQHVMQGGRTYYPGEVLEAEGENARHLIDSGVCEIVRALRPKKAQTKPIAPASGVTIGAREVA